LNKNNLKEKIAGKLKGLTKIFACTLGNRMKESHSFKNLLHVKKQVGGCGGKIFLRVGGWWVGGWGGGVKSFSRISSSNQK
jgi:hypothetical protein